MFGSNDQPVSPGEQTASSEWLSAARTLLDSLAPAEQGIEATLGRRKISTADSSGIDFLAERVERGLGWLERTSATVHAEASIELRATLGVLRNLGFAVRRLSTGEDNEALRRSCDFLIEQSHLHFEAAARALDEAASRPL